MKRKLFAGIAAALAAVMCVSFAACGEKGGADEAKNIAGEEVTEAQWEAAFEALSDKSEFGFTMTAVDTEVATNVTDPETDKKLNGKLTKTQEVVYSKKSNGEFYKESYKSTETAELSGDARRIMAVAGMGEVVGAIPEKDSTTVTSQIYAEETASGYVQYEQAEDGTWRTEPYYSLAPSFGSNFASQYGNHVYSAEYKGYIPKNYSAESGEELGIVKFDKQGKLIAIYYEVASEFEVLYGEVRSKSTIGYIFTYDVKDFSLPALSAA